MNRNGAVVLVAGNDIVVRRANGTEALLPFPSVAALRSVFLSYQQQVVPGNAAEIRNVAIADDGTPFIALMSPVDGAAFYIQEASFLWQGAGWRSAFTLPIPYGLTNTYVAAAASPTRWIAGRDFLFLDPAEIADASTDIKDQALLIDGNQKRVLGHGTPTAISDKYVVGYDFGFHPPGFTPDASPPVRAIEWIGGHQSVLGKGVAWAVNARGDVVGDDRRSINNPGVPVLWRNGREIDLSNQQGSAYAISSNGTIVGAIGDSAFVARTDDSIRKARRLDDLLVNGGWHIRAAYAVSDRGQILALANRMGSPTPTIVELRPVTPCS